MSAATPSTRSRSREPRDQILGLIPARGGSKGVPRKNIAPLAGKPLIARTIEAALASHEFDRVVVSTDDAEIAEVSRRAGAEAPFMRPAELAQDSTPGILPILHALTWFAENENWRPEWLMLLQPTSPFRTADDIRQAIATARDRAADAVVSVCLVHEHPYRLHRMSDEGRLTDYMPEGRNYGSRQELPPLYFQNGAIYLIRREVVMKEHTLFPPRCCGYVMPPDRSLQIDTPWDFRLCEAVLRDRRELETAPR